jgi:hypothetical protein
LFFDKLYIVIFYLKINLSRFKSDAHPFGFGEFASVYKGFDRQEKKNFFLKRNSSDKLQKKSQYIQKEVLLEQN